MLSPTTVWTDTVLNTQMHMYPHGTPVLHLANIHVTSFHVKSF